jgi:hypothetical protein
MCIRLAWRRPFAIIRAQNRSFSSVPNHSDSPTAVSFETRRYTSLQPHTNCVKTWHSMKLTSASWVRPVCGGFHNLIRFNCDPFFASCRRHRVLTVTCLDACRCAACLTDWTLRCLELNWRSDNSAAIFRPIWNLQRYMQVGFGIFLNRIAITYWDLQTMVRENCKLCQSHNMKIVCRVIHQVMNDMCRYGIRRFIITKSRQWTRGSI